MLISFLKDKKLFIQKNFMHLSIIIYLFILYYIVLHFALSHFLKVMVTVVYNEDDIFSDGILFLKNNLK